MTFLLVQVVFQIGVVKHTSDFIVLHVLNVDEIAEFFKFAEDHLIELQYLTHCDYVIPLFQLQHAHQGSHDEIEASYVNISLSNSCFT
jgi:molybdenum cofactor biosynthesis enzyme MoaA